MTQLSHDKSTTVRPGSSKAAETRRAPAWMRRSIGAVEAVSPEAAARIAATLFFQTRRMRPGASAAFGLARRFRVPFEGETLAAWSWGRGPTVVLTHGWNGRATQLAPFVEPLVAAGFRVVTFDHVGHGESTGRSSNLGQMTRALVRVVEGEERPVGLLAHSLGAAAATLALSDGLDAWGAVLIGAPISPEPWVAEMGRMLGLGAPTLARAQATIESKVGRTFDEVYGPTLAARLDLPALIVHDRADREVPAACGERLHEAWADSRLLLTEGLGHRRVLADDEVIAAARDFLTLHSTKIGLE